MKYKFAKEKLIALKNIERKRYALLGHNLEDEVFEEIEILEKENDHLAAANLLSIYINFACYKNHSLLMNSDRECVILLIGHGLVSHVNQKNGATLISRKSKSGLQNIYNYTISEIFSAENGDTGVMYANDTILINNN